MDFRLSACIILATTYLFLCTGKADALVVVLVIANKLCLPRSTDESQNKEIIYHIHVFSLNAEFGLQRVRMKCFMYFINEHVIRNFSYNSESMWFSCRHSNLQMRKKNEAIQKKAPASRGSKIFEKFLRRLLTT